MNENAIFGGMFFVVLFLYCVFHVVSLFFSVPVVRCSCVSLVVLLLCFCCFVSVSALLLLCFCLSAPLLLHKSEMQPSICYKNCANNNLSLKSNTCEERRNPISHSKTGNSLSHRHFPFFQLFLPPAGLPCREAENTVKTSAKCTFISVSAREHPPVGGNNQNIPKHVISFHDIPKKTRAFQNIP